MDKRLDALFAFFAFCGLRRPIARWRQRHMMAATRTALNALDDRGLNDLGLCRSEILSVAHELAGGVDASRLRVLRSAEGR